MVSRSYCTEGVGGEGDGYNNQLVATKRMFGLAAVYIQCSHGYASCPRFRESAIKPAKKSPLPPACCRLRFAATR